MNYIITRKFKNKGCRAVENNVTGKKDTGEDTKNVFREFFYSGNIICV